MTLLDKDPNTIYDDGKTTVRTVPDPHAHKPWKVEHPLGFELTGSCGHSAGYNNLEIKTRKIDSARNKFICKKCESITQLERMVPLPPSAFMGYGIEGHLPKPEK